MQEQQSPPGFLIEARRIAKRFGPVVALSDASFGCRGGEIHALLGANGAGKSTLVKILSGVVVPDSGDLLLDGAPVHLVNPAQAAQVGVATVFQELSLFVRQTVAENIVAGREPRHRWGLVDARAVRARALTILQRLSIEHLHPDDRVSDLSLSDRQLIEICKALSHDPRVLILDEATSALPQRDVDKLCNLLGLLKGLGLGIIFISHRMAEIRRIADRMTVLRDGRSVASFASGEIDDAAVIQEMLGRRLSRSLSRNARRRSAAPPALAVTDLRVPGRLDHVLFAIGQGEVVGLTGLESQGQTDLLFALFGVYRHTSGRIEVAGRPTRLGAPWRAVRAGIAMVPAERKTMGALLPLSIRENVALPVLAALSCFGFMRRHMERQRTRSLATELEIVASSIDAPVASLSGGNQQKVVLAKWFGTPASVFLFYDPTRGIDIGAKEAVYRLIRRLAADGKGILLYSTEIEELVALCDRVLVMDRGRLVSTLEADDISEATILRATLGIVKDATAPEPVGGAA